MSRDNRVVGEKNQVQCIVTDSGRIVTEKELKKYEVPSSKQLSSGMFKYDKTIAPPHDLMKLMSWLYLSVVHNSCVNTKVQDTVGIGYFLEPEEEAKIKDKEKDKNYKFLMDFFNKVNDKENLTKMLKKVALDYEGCGNSYIEVSRGKDGKVNGLYHVNATTIKWHRDKDKLVQKVGQKYVYFKLFGEEKILDRFTGEWVDTIGDLDAVANEVIPIIQYTFMSAVYGLPEWLPALYYMYGDMKEMEYNTDFFSNFGIPAYALIIEGGTLTQEVSDEVSKYFETTLKGSSHKTLTLGTPSGVTLRFERLSVETKEASFRMYHKDNRDSILTAHRVPPYRAAIVEQGSLGGNVATETDRIYLDSVINPRQADFSWIINELIIKQGLEINGWIFGFEDINVDDRDKDSQIYQRYVNIGAMTPNEVRQELGLEAYEGGDVHYLPGSYVPVSGEQDDTKPDKEGKEPDGVDDTGSEE